MKRIFPILLLICTLGYGQQFNADMNSIPYTGEYALVNDIQTLNFDFEKSKVSFVFIEDNTDGTIGGLDFDIHFNPADPENSKFIGTAKVKTLDTDNFLRDGHLMWKKFFNEDDYPLIKYVSTQVVDFEDNTFKVIGDLTIKGITKEIVITFIYNSDSLNGKTTINTSDFDINIHSEKEQNKLIVDFYFPVKKFLSKMKSNGT